MKKTTLVLTLFVAALLAGLFLQWSASQAAPAKASTDDDVTKERFMQQERGMPIDMQTVEGPVGVQGYSGTPPLLGSEPKPTPLKPYDMANDTALFAFQNNKIGADCCPSPFSSDGGCVCLTDEQIQSFSKRGGNRA